MKQARACSSPGENWHHMAHVCMPQLSLSPKDDVLIRTAYWEQTVWEQPHPCHNSDCAQARLGQHRLGQNSN